MLPFFLKTLLHHYSSQVCSASPGASHAVTEKLADNTQIVFDFIQWANSSSGRLQFVGSWLCCRSEKGMSAEMQTGVGNHILVKTLLGEAAW